MVRRSVAGRTENGEVDSVGRTELGESDYFGRIECDFGPQRDCFHSGNERKLHEASRFQNLRVSEPRADRRRQKGTAEFFFEPIHEDTFRRPFWRRSATHYARSVRHKWRLLQPRRNFLKGDRVLTDGKGKQRKFERSAQIRTNLQQRHETTQNGARNRLRRGRKTALPKKRIARVDQIGEVFQGRVRKLPRTQTQESHSPQLQLLPPTQKRTLQNHVRPPRDL